MLLLMKALQAYIRTHNYKQYKNIYIYIHTYIYYIYIHILKVNLDLFLILMDATWPPGSLGPMP